MGKFPIGGGGSPIRRRSVTESFLSSPGNATRVRRQTGLKHKRQKARLDESFRPKSFVAHFLSLSLFLSCLFSYTFIMSTRLKIRVMSLFSRVMDGRLLPSDALTFRPRTRKLSDHTRSVVPVRQMIVERRMLPSFRPSVRFPHGLRRKFSFDVKNENSVLY